MNNRGSFLIFSYMVISVLTILSTAFVVGVMTESTGVKQYVNSEQAFYIAEAGLSDALVNIRFDNTWYPSGNVTFGGGAYFVQRVNAGTTVDLLVTGTYNGVIRRVKGSLAQSVNMNPYENTISSGGNFTTLALFTRINAYNQTRLNGTYRELFMGTEYFEDKVEYAPDANVTLSIPDSNNNSVTGEFVDYLMFTDGIVASYPANETVVIPNNTTTPTLIYPAVNNTGVKIIYIRGSTAGTGNANILFGTSWQDNEDITVISTGSIGYVQPLGVASNSRLSTMSYNNYTQASLFYATHDSVVFANENANFLAVGNSDMNGNLIANEGIGVGALFARFDYHYDERALAGDLPPGFEGFTGGTGLSHNLTDWQEW